MAERSDRLTAAAPTGTLRNEPVLVRPKCLLTGATGTFGRAFLDRVLPLGWQVRAYSRDEYKQQRAAREVAGDVRWLIGDVRDLDRLRRAIYDCEVVVHAAALKQIPSCEYNPHETIKTNVQGSINVTDACLDNQVEKAVLLSSDKAVHPVNVYGASKLCAEKVWLASNAYAGTRFSCVRYGNVKGSRGSVLERQGLVRLTDPRATRFWMDVSEAVDLVLLALRRMRGGEIFIPKLSSGRVSDLLRVNSGDHTGLRPGEKLHETLISDEETRRTWDCGSHYQISEQHPLDGAPVPDGFRYTSETTTVA